MGRNFLKFALIFIVSILPLSLIFANQRFTPTEKIYVLRVTSLNPNKTTVPFTGSYVVTGKNGYRVIHFLFGDKAMSPVNTPYETTIKGSALSTMIISTSDPHVENIKVEIFEKVGNKKNFLLSGSGLTIVSTNDANLVFNNVYAK